MNAFTPESLTFQQFALLEQAESGRIRVSGGSKRTARVLAGRGLGALLSGSAGHWFEVSEKGREQLRMRR